MNAPKGQNSKAQGNALGQDAGDVRVQRSSHVTMDRGLSVLGAEDEVDDNLGK
jgi:hypothetical protein